MKLSRHHLISLFAATALFISLVIIRFEMVGELNLTVSQGFSTGLLRGIFYDLFMVVFSLTLGSIIVSIAGRGFGLGFFVGALVSWLTSLANLLHYRFFKIPLDWWIVEHHWQDIFVIQGSVKELAGAIPIGVSLTFFLLSLIAIALASPKQAKPFKQEAKSGRKRHLRLTVGAALLLMVMWRLPFWLELQPVNRLLGDHLVRAWLFDAAHQERLYASSGMKWAGELSLHQNDARHSGASKQLAKYRDFYAITPDEGTAAPLVRNLQPSPEETLELRKHLGLPLEGKLNVVILFLESVRTYEFLHPQIGKEIFPRLHQLFDQYGSVFDQAYSSSFRAGQTVRGQFSTLCSMLPNVNGAATYIAHTTLRINCIQSVLKDAGYQTAWFNSYKADFHRKRSFEILHGMDQFYDGSYFRKQGITQTIGEWGLADKPVLQETLKKLEELAESDQPLFSHILTISSHHPYSVIEEGPVPEHLLKATESTPHYQGYLSRLRYVDESVGDFIEGFMKSKLSDNTVLITLGDHSSPVLPPDELSLVQNREIRFRIPMAILTKNHPNPQHYSHPVHQVDVTPTLSRILGIGGKVAWLGNNLFEAPGSPWVYQVEKRLSYRTQSHGCYNSGSDGEINCYDLQDVDPLFADSLLEIPEDEQESLFFKKTVHALVESIALNRIMN